MKGWGVRVFDLWSDDSDLSPRQVLWLLSTLGEDSAYIAARKGGQKFVGWDYDRYLRVHHAELMHHLIFVLRKVNGDKKAKPSKPLWRPDDAERKRTEGQNMFAAMAKQALSQLH